MNNSRSEYNGFYTAKIYTTDTFLRIGINAIIDEYLKTNILRCHFSIFTSEYYYDVFESKQSHYDTVFLFITSQQTYRFIRSIPALRIPMHLTSTKLFELLEKSTPHQRYEPQGKTCFSLSDRELTFISLCRMGLIPADISKAMNLHLKTVYDLRLCVMKKLECPTFNALSVLIHSKIFNKWLEYQSREVGKAITTNMILKEEKSVSTHLS